MYKKISTKYHRKNFDKEFPSLKTNNSVAKSSSTLQKLSSVEGIINTTSEKETFRLDSQRRDIEEKSKLQKLGSTSEKETFRLDSQRRNIEEKSKLQKLGSTSEKETFRLDSQRRDIEEKSKLQKLGSVEGINININTTSEKETCRLDSQRRNIEEKSKLIADKKHLEMYLNHKKLESEKIIIDELFKEIDKERIKFDSQFNESKLSKEIDKDETSKEVDRDKSPVSLTKSGSKMRATSPQFIPSYLSVEEINEIKLTDIKNIFPSHITTLRSVCYSPIIICTYPIRKINFPYTNRGRNHYQKFDVRTGKNEEKIEIEKIQGNSVSTETKYIFSESISESVKNFFILYPNVFQEIIRNIKNVTNIVNNCNYMCKINCKEYKIILEFENELFCSGFSYILINLDKYLTILN